MWRIAVVVVRRRIGYYYLDVYRGSAYFDRYIVVVIVWGRIEPVVLLRDDVYFIGYIVDVAVVLNRIGPLQCEIIMSGSTSIGGAVV